MPNVERLSFAIRLLYTYGLLTEKQRDDARRKLPARKVCGACNDTGFLDSAGFSVDSCPSCEGSSDLWSPIETMPEGKWVFVYVPGASGSGVEAIKKPNSEGAFWAGRIIGLQRGKEITQASHWRPAFAPPAGTPRNVNALYEGDPRP